MRNDQDSEKEVCNHSLTPRKRPQMKDECCTIGTCSRSPEDRHKKEQGFTVNQRPPRAVDLRKKEQFLYQKEKELIKLQKCIEKQQCQLKKKFYDKAKADLNAAKKLNRARKKLPLTVNATRKIGRCDQKKQPEKKQSLSCTKCMDTQYGWTDRIHSMVEKYVNVARKIGRGDQKKQLDIKQSLSCFIGTQCKWLDKVHSMMDNFHGNLSSGFCERRRGVTELCALYVKKIRGAYRCAEVDSGCTDHFFGNRPYRSQSCNYMESAAGDCYKTARRSVMLSWPGPSPRPPCRVQLKQAWYFLALITSLFWLPCLFCVALMCCCCDCS